MTSAVIYDRGAISLQFLEAARVREQLAQDAPRLFGGIVHRCRRFAAEQIERWQEVVRAAAVLEAADELEQDAVDAIAETCLVPVQLARMFLALVEKERLDVVTLDRFTGKVEVLVAQRLEYRQTLAPTTSEE